VNKDEFFLQIDSILGNQHPGIGLIRYYSDSNIHVLLHTPSFSKVFDKPDIAIKEISSLMTK